MNNTLDKQYQDLLQTILDYGVEKKDRTGTGTKSIFGYTIRHNMKNGFPLLTTKKMAWKQIVTELLWFLRGDTNIKYLVDNNCHIWDGDAYQAYLKNVNEQDIESRKYEDGELTTYDKEEFINKIKTDDEFAKKWGDLGPIYGKQWRKWTKKKMYLSTDGSYENIYDEADQTVIDQIAILINDLKTNPDSRRLMVSAWNVGELDKMALPPCHYGFQVYTRELSWIERYEYMYNINVRADDGLRPPLTPEMLEQHNIPTRAISLMWNQRSVDTLLGLPFNIASYGLLLTIIAKEVNMIPDELIGNLGDTHLYLNHIEQAKEQIGRELSLGERIQLWQNQQDGRGHFIMECLDNIPTRTREPFELPKLVINDEFWNPDAGIIEQINHIEVSDFYVTDYQSHPTIKAPLSN
jgi:thymidylate synthase